MQGTKVARAMRYDADVCINAICSVLALPEFRLGKRRRVVIFNLSTQLWYFAVRLMSVFNEQWNRIRAGIPIIDFRPTYCEIAS